MRVGSAVDPKAGAATHDGPLPAPTDETNWPPLTPEYRAKYRIIVRALAEGRRLNDQTANCLPPGFPWMMNLLYPMELHQSATKITMITEWAAQIRWIYIGDKAHPDDPDPSYFGHSIANWDGDTLVVDTVALKPDTALNDSGLPHSDQIHVIERLSSGPDDTMDNELTIIDPKMLTRPWTRVLHYRKAPDDTRLLEYVCENNRDAVDLKAGRAEFDGSGK